MYFNMIINIYILSNSCFINILKVAPNYFKSGPKLPGPNLPGPILLVFPHGLKLKEAISILKNV